MTAPDPDLPESEVVFRRAAAVRRPLLWGSVSLLLLAAVAGVAGISLGPAFYAIAGVLALASLGTVAVYVAESSFRTVVRPSGITTRGYVRRAIPWSEVAGFQVRGPGADAVAPLADTAGDAVGAEPRALVGSTGRMGPLWTGHVDPRALPQAAKARVVVIRRHGRAVRLPAPVVAGQKGDYTFTDDVRQLEQWRLRYAGLTPPAVTR